MPDPVPFSFNAGLSGLYASPLDEIGADVAGLLAFNFEDVEGALAAAARLIDARLDALDPPGRHVRIFLQCILETLNLLRQLDDRFQGKGFKEKVPVDARAQRGIENVKQSFAISLIDLGLAMGRFEHAHRDGPPGVSDALGLEGKIENLVDGGEDLAEESRGARR